MAKSYAVSPTETTSWSNTASPTDWCLATNTTATTPLAQVYNWISMPTVRRGCITTSSGIMSLMQVGLLIRIRLGWMVEITYTYLLSIARYGSMHWDFPKLHGGKVALILSLIVQMLQIFAKLWQIQILRMQYQML